MQRRGDSRSMSERRDIQNAWMERKQMESIQNMMSGMGQAAQNPGFMRGFGQELGNSIQGRFGMGAALSSAMRQGAGSIEDALRFGRYLETKKLKQTGEIAQLGADTARYGVDAELKGSMYGADVNKSIADTQYGAENKMKDMITNFYSSNADVLRKRLLPPETIEDGIATPGQATPGIDISNQGMARSHALSLYPQYPGLTGSLKKRLPQSYPPIGPTEIEDLLSAR